MILYQDNVVKLDYSPAKDVIELVWPDMQEVFLPEIRQALAKTVEVIRLYDVKNLLIDASNSSVVLNASESHALSIEMVKELSYTRLQRLARIETQDMAREQANVAQWSEIKKVAQVSFEFQTFADKSSALEWLQAKQSASV
ncbi:hypothetical protein OB13_03020 [Pontibacter sp. HJ8]